MIFPKFDWLRQIDALEFVDLFCGDELGSGIDRRVFECKLDPAIVIKIERPDTTRFQNILEFQTWNDLGHTPLGKWLAPVRRVSDSGFVLLMAKTEPVPKGKLPLRMPEWLTDCKASNYGMLEGRVVCHDYGTNLIIAHASKRLRKVHWN